MNQELWLKRRAASAAAPLEKPSKYVLVTCRSLSAGENKALSKNFKQIIVYNSALNSGNLDIASMAFDLLVIDASQKENHMFLENISALLPGLNIPAIVLKKRFSNYKDLATGLDGYVVSRIEDLEGPNFFSFLTKSKLPKLRSRLRTLLKKLFALLLK